MTLYGSLDVAMTMESFLPVTPALLEIQAGISSSRPACTRQWDAVSNTPTPKQGMSEIECLHVGKDIYEKLTKGYARSTLSWQPLQIQFQNM